MVMLVYQRVPYSEKSMVHHGHHLSTPHRKWGEMSQKTSGDRGTSVGILAYGSKHVKTCQNGT